jgi:adenylate cyclase class 2
MENARRPWGATASPFRGLCAEGEMETLEIEIKAWCRDFDDIMKALAEAGAREVETVLEEDIYFNHPARDFRESDEALRLRNVGSGYILTYKGPRFPGRAKTRVEHEVAVDSFDSMSIILQKLGFVESGSVHKKRTILTLGDIKICLDSVRNLGSFVELEKMGTEREAVEQELFDLAERLGLRSFEQRSYLELVLTRAEAPF